MSKSKFEGPVQFEVDAADKLHVLGFALLLLDDPRNKCRRNERKRNQYEETNDCCHEIVDDCVVSNRKRKRMVNDLHSDVAAPQALPYVALPRMLLRLRHRNDSLQKR